MTTPRCAICAIPLTRFAAYCDQADVAYCRDHWSGVGCEKLHGECCATFVWNDDDLARRQDREPLAGIHHGLSPDAARKLDDWLVAELAKESEEA